MRQDLKKAYQTFLDEWGYEAQAMKAIEEMAELTKELCKKYFSGESYNKDGLLEEIADVLNMTEELEYCFGEQEIEEIRKQKIHRTLKKIERLKKDKQGDQNG